MSLFRKP